MFPIDLSAPYLPEKELPWTEFPIQKSIENWKNEYQLNAKNLVIRKKKLNAVNGSRWSWNLYVHLNLQGHSSLQSLSVANNERRLKEMLTSLFKIGFDRERSYFNYNFIIEKLTLKNTNTSSDVLIKNTVIYNHLQPYLKVLIASQSAFNRGVAYYNQMFRRLKKIEVDEKGDFSHFLQLKGATLSTTKPELPAELYVASQAPPLMPPLPTVRRTRRNPPKIRRLPNKDKDEKNGSERPFISPPGAVPETVRETGPETVRETVTPPLSPSPEFPLPFLIVETSQSQFKEIAETVPAETDDLKTLLNFLQCP